MKKQRNIIRIIHLIGAAAIGTYVYSPYNQLEVFTLTMQVIVIPVLTLTGVWLWKPKWFRKNKKTSILLVLGLLSMASLNTLQAQTRLKGGSGGFMIGFKSYNTNAYQYFVNERDSQLGNGLIQIGGEGYGILNRWIIGGGGYFNGGDRFEDSNIEYALGGGGGYINVGYVVYHSNHLLIFPLLGLGADALGIKRRVSGDLLFEANRFLEANYFYLTPTLDLGIGADWFPGKKGFKLGLRTGYNYSFSRNNTWRHYGGKVSNSDLPNNDLNGFYVRLTVGGGYFTRED